MHKEKACFRWVGCLAESLLVMNLKFKFVETRCDSRKSVSQSVS